MSASVPPPRSARTTIPSTAASRCPHSLNGPLLAAQQLPRGFVRPLAAVNLIAQGFQTYVARPDLCYGVPITGSGPAPRRRWLRDRFALPPVRRRARHVSKPPRIPRIRARVSAPGRRDPIGTAPASVDRDGQDVVSGGARGGTPVGAAGCSPQIDTAEGSIGSASFARTPWPALSRRGASCRAAA